MPWLPICVATFWRRAMSRIARASPTSCVKRLFQVHVLAAFHGRRGDHGVRVHGSGHDDRVDLAFHLVEHLAEIAELAGRGEELGRPRPTASG